MEDAGVRAAQGGASGFNPRLTLDIMRHHATSPLTADLPLPTVRYIRALNGLQRHPQTGRIVPRRGASRVRLPGPGWAGEPKTGWRGSKPGFSRAAASARTRS